MLKVKRDRSKPPNLKKSGFSPTEKPFSQYDNPRNLISPLIEKN
ncbi:hypothetical protein [Brunnivagina elsteri]|nr:hypothetical protein [Calothrix elsteri]